MIVASFDISTNTGVCVYDAQPNKEPTRLHLETWSVKRLERPIDRARVFADHTMQFLREYQPDLIIIEGYATGSRNMSTAIIETSALIKFVLAANGYDWIEIPPKSLKVFTADNGNVKKDVIIKQVYKLWGIDTDDDNQADAVALCQMGLNLLGFDNVPSKHLRAWTELKKHDDYVRVTSKVLKKFNG
ncbi:ribonuclease [Vibrio phage vB_VhaS-VHB1]|nr:ribonuclease [Vibrio phage vB_VhaS-VHB1]